MNSHLYRVIIMFADGIQLEHSNSGRIVRCATVENGRRNGQAKFASRRMARIFSQRRGKLAAYCQSFVAF